MFFECIIFVYFVKWLCDLCCIVEYEVLYIIFDFVFELYKIFAFKVKVKFIL